MRAVFAQLEKSAKFPVEFVVGTSYTYIWNTENSLGLNTQKYNEHTVNINFAVSFTNRFWIGIQALSIFTKQNMGLATNRSNYTILGAFLQYSFLKQDNWKIYAETSFNYGDYCTCGKKDPYREKGLTYFGLGLGSQLPLKFYFKTP